MARSISYRETWEVMGTDVTTQARLLLHHSIPEQGMPAVLAYAEIFLDLASALWQGDMQAEHGL